MNRILTHLTLALTIACALPATAEPFCSNLNAKDLLPKKYQKRGPFYSDVSTGWIVGHDQLKDKYAVTDEAVSLWRGVKAEFDKHGVNLVVLTAPPRPLFMPDKAIDAKALPIDVDLEGLKDGFSTYIAALNSVGIVAPDLSVISQGPKAAEYYFARDTHWTPMGAALSVAHLTAAMGDTAVQDNIARLEMTSTYEEKGSLAGVVQETCGIRPELETVSAPQYAQQGSASSLFGDAPIKDKVALIGTSFSDRYQRDAYQVADALAFMMDASVDNFAVTGGGLIGSMEAFIRNGALENGNYQTVVWESPYSTPLTNVDGLRQVLGVLRLAGEQTQVGSLNTRIGKDWISLDHGFSTMDVRSLEIDTDSTNTGQLIVELIDIDGEKTRIKLFKTDRVASDMRSTKWAIFLKGMPASQIVRIKLRHPKASKQEAAIIRFFN